MASVRYHRQPEGKRCGVGARRIKKATTSPAPITPHEHPRSMTLSQFNCPHCSGPFQVDASLPSLQVACPHCRQPVFVNNEPPVVGNQVSEPPAVEAEPPPIDPPVAERGTPHGPVDRRRDYTPADLLPPGARTSTVATVPEQVEPQDATVDEFRTRQIAADERATRKFVKNMIVWVCCAIVLVSILAYFLA